jgi:hypothetical protein
VVPIGTSTTAKAAGSVLSLGETDDPESKLEERINEQADSLSLWYRAEAMARKPHRNHHFSESEMGANGFRGRVSQVRILPGPLSLRVLHEPPSQE